MFFKRREAKSKLINPNDMINMYTLEEHCEWSEKYALEIVNLGKEVIEREISKPFIDTLECSYNLIKLGSLINGLKLSPTMVVVDFGSGVCWLSRLLNQLHCITISVDTSASILEIGKKFFNDYPIIGPYIKEPLFLKFNGERIELENESVDRIICFDSFHHVPNQENVLKEFYRILKPGGIFGFCEPGKEHSRTNKAQHEMKNFKVLENDIDISKIAKLACKIGFKKPYFKLFCEPDINLSLFQYLKMVRFKLLPFKAYSKILSSMNNTLLTLFVKGQFVHDSRINYGLTSKITVEQNYMEVQHNQPFFIDVEITNTGEAIWLHQNLGDFGVVKLGAHLYNSEKEPIKLSYKRWNLASDVNPKQKIKMNIELVLDKPGDYIISLDLVSEKIIWFEHTNNNKVFDIRIKSN